MTAAVHRIAWPTVSWARVTAYVLAAALGFIPLAPPEHVHEETDEAGHHTVIVHRHATLHRLETIADVGHGTVDHPDPIALFPDSTYTAPAPYVLRPPAMPATFVLTPPERPVVDRRPRWSDQLIHAPPRAPSSLRAPPLSPFL